MSSTLTIHHAGAHTRGAPDRCRCLERTRLRGDSEDGRFEPTDRYTFITSATRDRYARDHVDPRCQVEKDAGDPEWVARIQAIAQEVVSAAGGVA